MSSLLQLLQPISVSQRNDTTISIKILLDANGAIISVNASVTEHVARVIGNISINTSVTERVVCVRHYTKSLQRSCVVTINCCPQGGHRCAQDHTAGD